MGRGSRMDEAEGALTTEIAYHLKTSEVNTILDALLKEFNNTRKRKWRLSEKALHMAEINRIRNKLVSQEMEATKGTDNESS